MATLFDQHGRELRRTARPQKSAWSSVYRATNPGRHRTFVSYSVQDASNDVQRATRRQLMGYARYLAENSGMIRGAIGDMARYSVGCGLRPQSLAEASDDYEAYFREWAKIADVTGQHTFWRLQRLASVRMDLDGDMGFLMVGGPDSFPQLQPVESHNIDAPERKYDAPEGYRLSAAGRPTTWYLRDGEKFRAVPAQNFIIVADPDRVKQHRGMTALAHAIEHMRDEMDLLEFEKIGVKVNSAIGLAITTQGGNSDEGLDVIETGYTAADTENVPWSKFEPGMIPHLKLGEQIQSFQSSRPSATFTGFIETLMRDVALGLGLPYEFIVDPAKQGTASRFILEKAARRFEERQELIETRFCDRVWTWVIGRAIKRGDLPASPGWWRAKWQRPKKITVDAGRDAKANIDGLKMGTRTLAEDAGERGQDWQDLRNQTEAETRDLLDRAQGIARQYDIPMETALNLLSQRTPNPNFQNNAPQPVDDDQE